MINYFIGKTNKSSAAEYPRSTLMILLSVVWVCGVHAQTTPAGNTLSVGQNYDVLPPPGKKQPAWSGWELHGAVSTSIPDYDYWTVSNSYERSADRNAARRFVRNDGSQVYANGFGEEAPDQPLVNDKIYQLGIGRQTSWGGLWRFSAGLYHSSFRMKNDEFTDLQPNEIRTFIDNREMVVMTEVGLHYVFRRRSRFRPYVGAHAVIFPYYDGVSTLSFVEGDTGETGLVERFSSTEYFPPYIDLSLTLGFQYQLNEHLSAGAFLWVNGGADLYLDAPLGVEVRYSPKKRPLRKTHGGKTRWY